MIDAFLNGLFPNRRRLKNALDDVRHLNNELEEYKVRCKTLETKLFNENKARGELASKCQDLGDRNVQIFRAFEREKKTRIELVNRLLKFPIKGLDGKLIKSPYSDGKDSHLKWKEMEELVGIMKENNDKT